MEETPVAYQPEAEDPLALYELVRESEIDFEELHEAIRATVAQSGPCTVGQVLQAHPPTQGLASVVGLVHIADQHPVPVLRQSREKVTWTEEDGTVRSAHIPTLYFDHTTVKELQ